ncbi:MAG TPA: hypothetical protein PKH07_08565 [bacterium]|nr:hypothetical protein [bacterium]
MDNVLELANPFAQETTEEGNVERFILPPKVQAKQQQETQSISSKLKAMDDALIRFKFSVQQYRDSVTPGNECIIQDIDHGIMDLFALLEILKMGHRM